MCYILNASYILGCFFSNTLDLLKQLVLIVIKIAQNIVFKSAYFELYRYTFSYHV